MKGLVHLYYGDGKGKTTAAVGLSVRAAGRGLKVSFVQFMKGSQTGEIDILKKIDGIKVLRSEEDFGFFKHMPKEVQDNLTKVHNSILEEGFKFVENGGVIVLDEVTHAVNFGLIDEERLKSLILNRSEGTEVVMTGRNPRLWLIEEADYVCEIKNIKHPFDEGVGAREGIEF